MTLIIQGIQKIPSNSVLKGREREGGGGTRRGGDRDGISEQYDK